MPDDPMAALLDPALAEALDFIVLLAYAAGWNDALRDEQLTIADARIAARIEQAGIAWQARLVKGWGMPPTLPEWLRRAQEEQDTPRP